MFVLALLVRLLYLYESSDNPFYLVPLSDSETYIRLAKGLMQGGIDWRFFYQGVFYPLFLYLVYSAAGTSIVAVKIIQAVIGAFTALLTERLGTRIGGSTAGVIAGIITAFYGPLVFFDGELLATCWATFLTTVILLLIVIILEKCTPLRFLLLGVLGGLSVLNRPVFLPFLFISAVWVFWNLKKEKRQRLILCSGGLLLGFSLVVLPIAIINKQVTNHFDFLPSSGGLNLHIGNNLHTCDTLRIRPGSAWQKLVNEPIKHGFVYGADKENYYKEKFLRYVKEHPLDYLLGLGLKTIRFLNGREIPRNQDIYFFRQWSTFLTISTWKVDRFGFPFTVLLAFAAIGLFFGERRSLPMPFYLFLIIYPLSVIAVFVTARYRIPIIPCLSILAAIGTTTLVKSIRNRNSKSLLKHLLVGATAALVSSVPPTFCEEDINLDAEMYCLGAMFYFGEKNLDNAVAFSKKASKLNPRYYEAYELLGIALNEKQQLNASREALETAVELKPDAFYSLLYLGKTYGQLGRFSEGEAHLNRALVLNPQNGQVHSYLGICLANQDKLETAYQHLKKAVQLMPNDALSLQNLKAVRRRLSRKE